MDRLLVIVVTRDWASRGGPEDEFCVDWLQPSHEEYACFHCAELDLLLIHGYAERFESSACVQKAIMDHAKQCVDGRSYSACIILQHPGTLDRLIDPSAMSTVYGLQCKTQVMPYGTNYGTVQQVLDRAMSNLPDISSPTKEGWKEKFRKIAPVVARDRMAQLIHAIVHLFLPLEVDLSGLREAPDEKARRDYAAEILKTRAGDSYEVRLQKLRFWVAKVKRESCAVPLDSPLPSGQCFLELVLVCGLDLEDNLVEELVGLCGLINTGGAFRPENPERYETPREGDDQYQVDSFFKNLDEAREASALIKQSGAAVLKLGPDQKELDFLGWFARLRETMEGIHDRVLSVRRDAGGGE